MKTAFNIKYIHNLERNVTKERKKVFELLLALIHMCVLFSIVIIAFFTKAAATHLKEMALSNPQS